MKKQVKEKDNSTMVKQSSEPATVKESQTTKSNDGGYIWLV